MSVITALDGGEQSASYSGHLTWENGLCYPPCSFLGVNTFSAA